jgi:Replication protein
MASLAVPTLGILTGLRYQLADKLISRGQTYAGQRLKECNTQFGCNHRMCPQCSRRNAKRDSWGLIQSVGGISYPSLLHTVQSGSLLIPYEGTFTILDQPTNRLRDCRSLLTEGWQKVIRRCKQVQGWFRSTELVPSRTDPSLENLHIHSLLLADGGVDMAEHDWNGIWQQSVGSEVREAHVEPVRTLQGFCNYLDKHRLDYWIRQTRQALVDIPRFLERDQQLCGRRMQEYGGILRDTHSKLGGVPSVMAIAA